MKIMPNTPPGRAIYIGTLSLLFITVGAVLATYFLMPRQAERAYSRYAGRGDFAPFSARQAPPLENIPRLEVNERAYLAEYMEGQGKLLYNYAWIDRPGGVVRIPIYRAMEKVLEEGFPTRGGDR